MKTALITGITGQDGSYLAEFLQAKGCDVHGLIRRSRTFNTDRIEHIYHDFHDLGAKLKLAVNTDRAYFPAFPKKIHWKFYIMNRQSVFSLRRYII